MSSDRTISTYIPVNLDLNGNGTQVEVFTTHDKDRKVYRSSAIRQEVGDGFVRFELIGDVAFLGATNTSRFSAKKLQEFHEDKLSEIEDLRSRYEDVTRIFEGLPPLDGEGKPAAAEPEAAR